MGRFSSALLLLLAACGDNLDTDGFDPVPVDELATDGTSPATPRYVPFVCESLTWTTNLTGDTAMDVSVSPRPDGAIALVAPRTGGTMTGFVLDTRMHMLTAEKVAIDDTVSHVTASYLHNRVVSTAAHEGSVLLHVLDDDLTNPHLTAKLPGNALTEPTFFSMQGDLVMPVGADDGAWLHRFDDSFEPHGSTQLLATGPVRSIAAAQMGSSLLTAWSTDDACYMALASSFGPGVSTHAPSACRDPRIAVDPQTTRGIMVFEAAQGVRMMTVQTTQFGGVTRLLRSGTSAPRTVFDGTNFWVSYLDTRGDIIVGFLDGDDRPVTMSLAGPKPEAPAYELVLVDGAPWVFALTPGGYTAHRMCVDAQW